MCVREDERERERVKRDSKTRWGSTREEKKFWRENFDLIPITVKIY